MRWHYFWLLFEGAGDAPPEQSIRILDYFNSNLILNKMFLYDERTAVKGGNAQGQKGDRRAGSGTLAARLGA
eukprot:gene3957-11544_t